MTEQHNHHIIAWLRLMSLPVTELRYWNVWYRGKVSRTTQLNQLRAIGDKASYDWLKDFWRMELTKRRDPAAN